MVSVGKGNKRAQESPGEPREAGEASETSQDNLERTLLTLIYSSVFKGFLSARHLQSLGGMEIITFHLKKNAKRRGMPNK